MAACGPAAPAATPLALVPTDTLTPSVTPLPTLTASPIAPTNTTEPSATPLPPATPTPTSTPTLPPTATPTLEPTATPTITPSPTEKPFCTNRLPADALLTVVNRQYALSRDYEPADLVTLNDYFDATVTLGFGTRVRSVVVPSLVQMVNDMYAAGLAPTIISGYRSYVEQAIAWEKWNAQYPDRAAILSAQPGTSEHQLGTTVDFGSPALNNEFHTYFYMTPEGEWLLANAHLYGFSLSYPLEAFELTQFYYEPWHYRFVGVDMAVYLHETGITLTEWQLENMPVPCVTGE